MFIIVICLVLIMWILMHFKRKKIALQKEAEDCKKMMLSDEWCLPSQQRRYLNYQKQQSVLNRLMLGAILLVLLLGGRWMVLAHQWDNVVEQLGIEEQKQIHWYSENAARLRFYADVQPDSVKLQAFDAAYEQNYNFRLWQHAKCGKLYLWMGLWSVVAVAVYVILFRKKYYQCDRAYFGIALASIVFMVVELAAIGVMAMACLSAIVLCAMFEVLCWHVASLMLALLYPLNP